MQCPDVISAASFSPDGQLTAAGLFNGAVMFHHTNDLRYYTQVKRGLESAIDLNMVDLGAEAKCGFVRYAVVVYKV